MFVGLHRLGTGMEVGLPGLLTTRWRRMGMQRPLLHFHSTQGEGPLRAQEGQNALYLVYQIHDPGDNDHVKIFFCSGFQFP